MGYANIICGIYCIENINTHKKYIGQSKNIYKRWADHKCALNNNTHDNDYLQNAWNKYGESNFVFSVVEECSIEKLDEREIYYIQKFATYERKSGYNLRGGGGRINDMAPEIKEKLAGINNPMYGKHHSEAARQKMSNARKGIYANEKHPRSKPIYCIELHMSFWGAKEAQDLFGVNRNNICSCCNGRLEHAGRHPETGEFLHWIYLDSAIELGLYFDACNQIKGVV